MMAIEGRGKAWVSDFQSNTRALIWSPSMLESQGDADHKEVQALHLLMSMARNLKQQSELEEATHVWESGDVEFPSWTHHMHYLWIVAKGWHQPVKPVEPGRVPSRFRTRVEDAWRRVLGSNEDQEDEDHVPPSTPKRDRRHRSRSLDDRGDRHRRKHRENPSTPPLSDEKGQKKKRRTRDESDSDREDRKRRSRTSRDRREVDSGHSDSDREVYPRQERDRRRDRDSSREPSSSDSSRRSRRRNRSRGRRRDRRGKGYPSDSSGGSSPSSSDSDSEDSEDSYRRKKARRRKIRRAKRATSRRDHDAILRATLCEVAFNAKDQLRKDKGKDSMLKSWTDTNRKLFRILSASSYKEKGLPRLTSFASRLTKQKGIHRACTLIQEEATEGC